MYRNVESLCCVTETDIVLQVNYTSKIYQQTNSEKEIRFVVNRGRDVEKKELDCSQIFRLKGKKVLEI